MTTAPNPYCGFRFPAEVIEHAVWLYHCFSLSLRDVETILAARGIVVSYESIRDWGLRFGQMFANRGRFGISVKSGHKRLAGQKAVVDQPFSIWLRAGQCLYTRTLASAAGLGVRKRFSQRYQNYKVFSMR